MVGQVWGHFLGLRNALDYRLRQAVRLRRPGLTFKNEPKDGLFRHLPQPQQGQAEAQAGRLIEQYHLQALYDHSTRDNFRENLFYLELLEAALEATGAALPDTLQAADIGPSSWFYVQALHALLCWWRTSAGRSVALAGYEADAYRVYADFRSRYDHALAHQRGLAGVRYLPESFPPQAAACDLITALFPFVFLKDHLEWGLPRRLFEPGRLAARAWSSLKPGGLLVIANQGEAEHRAQRDRLAALEIPVAAAFRHDSLFYQYELPRWVLVSRRER